MEAKEVIKDEKMLVPRLRFREFLSPWQQIKLNKITLKLESGVSVNSFDEPITNNNEYGVLKTNCISSGRFYPKQNKKIIDEDVNRAKLNPLKNSILISRMNTPQLVGESGIVEKDYPNLFIPDRLWMAIIDQDRYNPKLVSILLSSEKVKSAISNIATGTSGSMKNISKPNFLNLGIILPSLSEQQKLSSFLSAVDEMIQQLTRKKELLEQYKKGVMQQIFSRKIKFKDENGRDFPEWEEKKIGDLIVESRIKGETGDVAKKITVKLWGKGVFSKEEKIAGSSQTQYYIRRKGQFIYSKLDFLNCAFGIIPDELDGFQSTVDLPAFDFKDNIDPWFFLERIKQKSFYRKFGETADGSRVAKRIHADIFCSFALLMPSFNEQQIISKFLILIDKKIDAISNQIDQTQTFKKGLLQQMFC